MSRIPEPGREGLTEAQAKVYEAVMASRGSLAGPFRVWLESPEFADRAQHLGEFVRYRTSLDARLSELAILVTARHWNCQVEWSLHEPIARKVGLEDGVIAALAERREPPFRGPDERAVYQYTRELLADRFVSRQAFDAVIAHLGSRGAVELTGIAGYYSLVAMTLNAFEVPLPEGSDPLLYDCPTHR